MFQMVNSFEIFLVLVNRIQGRLDIFLVTKFIKLSFLNLSKLESSLRFLRRNHSWRSTEAELSIVLPIFGVWQWWKMIQVPWQTRLNIHWYTYPCPRHGYWSLELIVLFRSKQPNTCACAWYCESIVSSSMFLFVKWVSMFRLVSVITHDSHF